MKRSKPLIDEPSIQDAYYHWPNTGIRAVKKQKTVDLYLDDVIGAQFGGVSPKQFNQEITEAGEVDQINLYINSPGGSVFDGLSMYNSLLNAHSRVVVEVTGLAASAASVVMLAGDERRMAESAFVMIHDPWDLVVGNATRHRSMADKLERYGEKIAKIYEDRTGLTIHNAEEMMSADGGDGTWLDSDEAEEMGFIHSIVGAEKMAAHVSAFVQVFRDQRPGIQLRKTTRDIDKRMDFIAKTLL